MAIDPQHAGSNRQRAIHVELYAHIHDRAHACPGTQQPLHHDFYALPVAIG